MATCNGVGAEGGAAWCLNRYIPLQLDIYNEGVRAGQAGEAKVCPPSVAYEYKAIWLRGLDVGEFEASTGYTVSHADHLLQKSK